MTIVSIVGSLFSITLIIIIYRQISVKVWKVINNSVLKTAINGQTSNETTFGLHLIKMNEI